jgi:hypothetical protein
MQEKAKVKKWDAEILELETFFASATLPAHTVKLDACTAISNCKNFIQAHLATIKANNGKITYLPYLNRLFRLKKVLNQ